MDEVAEPRVDDAWDEGAQAPEREVLTWERFGTAARELAQIVADDGYEPDVVIAIARGGLTVAGALAYALGVKNCGSMNVEFYTGVDERLDVPVVLPPTLDLVDVRGLQVLVADDVADTGHTLRLVREVLAQHVAEARTAVLYRKPRSVVAPDYAWRQTDQWIVFPWSAEPPVRAAERQKTRPARAARQRGGAAEDTSSAATRQRGGAAEATSSAAARQRGGAAEATSSGATGLGVRAVTAAVRAERLLGDIEALAKVGDTGDGGNCRLALTDDDAGGRELVVGWMRALGLDVRVDRIGNVVATRSGRDGTLDPVMTGSHIDTVRTGGRYDGTLGVLAGLEVVRALDDAGVRTRRPLAVAFFTDEEGSRFAPDMLGSLVYAGGMPLEDALDIVAIDGAVLGDELERIGWAGDAAVPGPAPHAYVELHIEQGPVLEEQGITIGAVTGVQGISWQELTLTGQSNHAGTTPMRLRHDAGYVAAEITTHVRRLALELGGDQVGTVGRLDLHPDLVNVVAARAA